MTDIGRLNVSLTAESASFTANLDKANRNLKGFAGRYNRAMGEMQRTTDLATKAVGALGIGLSAAALGNFARSSLQVAAATQQLADRAGIGAGALQELTFAARQYGVDQDALVDGMKELTLRADEFAVAGAGPGADAFERLGLTADEVNGLLGDSDRLFRTIVARMDELDRAAQIRVADELLGGTGGEQFVQLLRAGSDGIAEMREEARKLGIVMSDDVIENAAQANRELDTLASVMTTRLTVAAAEAIPPLVSIGNAIADIFAADDARAKAIHELLQADRAAEEVGGLSEQLSLAERAVASAQALVESSGGLLGNTRLAEAERHLTAVRERIAEVASARFDIESMAFPTPDPVIGSGSGDRAGQVSGRGAKASSGRNAEIIERLELQGQLIGLTDEERAIREAVQRLDETATEDQRRRVEALAAANFERQETVRAAIEAEDERARAIERQIAAGDAARQRVQDLEFEIDLIGKTAREQAILNEIKLAGVDADSEIGRQIRDRTGLLYDLSEAEKQAAEAQREADKIGREWMDALGFGLDSVLGQFGDWGRELGGIIDLLLDATGLGKDLAGSLGGLFGGGDGSFSIPGFGGGSFDFGGIGDFLGFADGGRPPLGVPSIVGERGPELFIPDRAGTVISNDALSAMGGSGSIDKIDINVIVDARNSVATQEIVEIAAERGAARGMQRVLESRRRGGAAYSAFRGA